MLKFRSTDATFNDLIVHQNAAEYGCVILCVCMCVFSHCCTTPIRMTISSNLTHTLLINVKFYSGRG